MSPERRLALLDWAARAGAYILEVDYDSDFRYEGALLPSLQSLDRNGCVIYLNSFSRSLGPACGLATWRRRRGIRAKAGAKSFRETTAHRSVRSGSLC
jgi:DNA-binding transcriptional MocR family regulator